MKEFARLISADDPIWKEGLTGNLLSAPRPQSHSWQHALHPNSAYFIRFYLLEDGRIDVKCHWYRQDNPNWEHDVPASVPEAAPAIIDKSHLKELVIAYLKGPPISNQWVERPSTGARVDFNWLSWIVIIFDHPNWEFDAGSDPVLRTTPGKPNHSYFEGHHVDAADRRNAFAFVNLMCADAQGRGLKRNDKVCDKFDLVMQVKMADGSVLRVLVDPTGTNNGPSGGGRPPP